MKFSQKNNKMLLFFIIIYGRYPNFKEVLFYKRFFHNNSLKNLFFEMIRRYEEIENFQMNLSDEELTNYFNDANNTSCVPKNIFMTLPNFDDLKEDCKMNMIKKEWEVLIDCRIHRYNDFQCREMIEKNFDQRVVDAYDKLIPGAFKSDIWRLCALYLHGGVYSDVHIIPEEKSNPNVVLDSADYVFCIDYPTSSKYIYNALMKMPKGSPIALQILDAIISNVENELYPICDLEVTGPGVHGKILMKILNINEFHEGFYDYSVENKHQSVLLLKHQKHHNRKHEFEYNISLHRNTLFLCRYKNYRREMNTICKTEHYSKLFDKKQIYHSNTINDDENNENDSDIDIENESTELY